MVDSGNRRRTALVTGASAGIGKAFAQVFAEDGLDLVLVARRKERLEELANELSKSHGAASTVIEADLADPEAPQQIFERLQADGVDVDILVNNAGFGVPEDYKDSQWADQARFMQVMATAPAHLTHLFLPGMIERNYGRFINVSSLAALFPGMAGHTLYSGVKSFLVKLSQSLNLELEGSDIHASVTCPGFTYTEYHDVIRTRESVSQYPEYMWMSAEDVARQSYEALKAGTVVFVPGFANRMLAGAASLLPESLIGKLGGTRQIVSP